MLFWILVGLFILTAAFLICKCLDIGRTVYHNELLLWQD